jgi:uncharacterized OsmC-like protein
LRISECGFEFPFENVRLAISETFLNSAVNNSESEITAVRRFTVEARSTDTFGRVLCAARRQHFVVDGPVQNGCPGEAVTPPEIFLAGVATCGVELLQVIARNESIPLRSVSAQIEGWIDREHPVRSDLMVFNGARLKFLIEGVTQSQADNLVQKFKSR